MGVTTHGARHRIGDVDKADVSYCRIRGFPAALISIQVCCCMQSDNQPFSKHRTCGSFCQELMRWSTLMRYQISASRHKDPLALHRLFDTNQTAEMETLHRQMREESPPILISSEIRKPRIGLS